MTVIGQTIFRSNRGENDVYHSPWFPAQGNMVSTICDVIHTLDQGSNLQFWVEIETKKSEYNDQAASSATEGGTAPNGIQVNTGQNQQTQVDGGQLLDSTLTGGFGLQDLVRFRFTLIGGTAGDMIHFRMLVGSWLAN